MSIGSTAFVLMYESSAKSRLIYFKRYIYTLYTLFTLVAPANSCAAGFKYIMVFVGRAVRNFTHVSICHHDSFDIIAASIVIFGFKAGTNPMTIFVARLT